AACRQHGVALACLPGDDRPDPELARLSTVPADTLGRLWAYLGHGGVDNAEQALRYAAALLGRAADWAEPRPLPRAGLYHPGREVADAPLLAAGRPEAGPWAVLVFYRALLQSGDLAAVDALLLELEAVGLAAIGVHVASLKDGDGAAL